MTWTCSTRCRPRTRMLQESQMGWDGMDGMDFWISGLCDGCICVLVMRGCWLPVASAFRRASQQQRNFAKKQTYEDVMILNWLNWWRFQHCQVGCDQVGEWWFDDLMCLWFKYKYLSTNRANPEAEVQSIQGIRHIGGPLLRQNFTFNLTLVPLCPSSLESQSSGQSCIANHHGWSG